MTLQSLRWLTWCTIAAAVVCALALASGDDWATMELEQQKPSWSLPAEATAAGPAQQASASPR